MRPAALEFVGPATGLCGCARRPMAAICAEREWDDRRVAVVQRNGVGKTVARKLTVDTDVVQVLLSGGALREGAV